MNMTDKLRAAFAAEVGSQPSPSKPPKAGAAGIRHVLTATVVTHGIEGLSADDLRERFAAPAVAVLNMKCEHDGVPLDGPWWLTTHGDEIAVTRAA